MSSPRSSTDAPRRWGEDSALFDEDEARRRLLEATGRCIVRKGSARVDVADVAKEAGVSRSTVYRYFPSRNDLVLELMTSRTDAAFARLVDELPSPLDAARTIPQLILGPLLLVGGDPLNEALFTADSRALVGSLGLGEERPVDVALTHVGPLFEQWQADGQIHADLDLRETVRWLNAVTWLLLTPPWNAMTSIDERRTFVDRYLVRALLTGRSPS